MQHVLKCLFCALCYIGKILCNQNAVVNDKATNSVICVYVHLIQDKTFGTAGETVVVEELLEGEEVSVSTKCSLSK